MRFCIPTLDRRFVSLKTLHGLQVDVAMLTFVFDCSDLQQLALKCSKMTERMKSPGLKIELSNDPIFLRTRAFPFGCGSHLTKLSSRCVRMGSPIRCSRQLRSHWLEPQICGDYRWTLNKCLIQRICATEETWPCSLSASKFQCIFKDWSKRCIPTYKYSWIRNQMCKITADTSSGLIHLNVWSLGLSISLVNFQ